MIRARNLVGKHYVESVCLQFLGSFLMLANLIGQSMRDAPMKMCRLLEFQMHQRH